MRTGKVDLKGSPAVIAGENLGFRRTVFKVLNAGQFGENRLRGKTSAVVVDVPVNGGTTVTRKQTAEVGVGTEFRSLRKTPETVAQPYHRQLRPGLIDPDQVSFVVVIDVPSQ